MDLEGIIVERLSGKTLQAFMQAEIFDPLQMVDTISWCRLQNETASRYFTMGRAAN
jgi:CubicO group peptidase (beta-lactamase class C family)